MSSDLSDLVLDVESAMTTIQRRSAYARFVSINPSWAGAYWADILDHLIDCDAHQEIIDALLVDAELTMDDVPFFAMAVLSLYYASGEIPTTSAVLDLVHAAQRGDE